VVEFDAESGLFMGTVPGLPGAHTQAADLDELQTNLREVISLCVEEQAIDLADLPVFVGLQLVEVTV